MQKELEKQTHSEKDSLRVTVHYIFCIVISILAVKITYHILWVMIPYMIVLNFCHRLVLGMPVKHIHKRFVICDVIVVGIILMSGISTSYYLLLLYIPYVVLSLHTHNLYGKSLENG